MNRRWILGLMALAGLVPIGAGATLPPGDPVADKFSFPVGAVPNSPTSSRYQMPNGQTFLGWAVHPAASFLSPAYGQELQPGEDWSGRGGGGTDLGQPVYAAAAGTIVAAGDYGPDWGHIVLIRHTMPDGTVVLTQYAYMADIVKNSGTVGWREVIGHIGTGRHGPVLHFEVRRDNMSEAPPDYWPSSDNKDVDWVRQHYFAPTQFVRTHYRILSLPATSTPPTTPAAPGDTTAPGGGTGGGTASPPGSPGPTPPWNSPGTVPGSFPLFPGEQPSSPPPTTTPFPSAWDGVPHLDGSILRSGTGDYYLLQSGKKWRIGGSDVLSTWARPEEALPATDVELASYPDGAHPLGLRIGTWFQGSSGPVCISADPFEEPGLACWAVMNEDWLARVGLSRGAIKTVSAQTMALYIRPGQFDQNTPLPRGVLIQQPYGGYYIVEDLTGYLPEVHPVTSSAALHSWQIDETMAVQIGSPDFWDRVLKLDPVPFRPGAILRSSTGQLYVVSGQYKYLVPSMDVLVRRGYNAANAIFATDADLALEKDWPTPLR